MAIKAVDRREPSHNLAFLDSFVKQHKAVVDLMVANVEWVQQIHKKESLRHYLALLHGKKKIALESTQYECIKNFFFL